MQTVSIGTIPVLLANADARRVRWTLQFTPSSIVAGNTGLIFIGRGYAPNAIVGDPNQGDILNAGAAIEEKKQYPDDALPYKGMIWAVSDTAAQKCEFDQTLSTEINSGAG